MKQPNKRPPEQSGTGTAPPDAATVVAFWREAGPARWFRKDPAFDADFHTRFLALHMAAARRELENNAIEPSRIARVVGYADQELYVKLDPRDPRNRRISVILLSPG